MLPDLWQQGSTVQVYFTICTQPLKPLLQITELAPLLAVVQAMFSVFDGHGGRHAADFAAENLHAHILEAIQAKEAVAEGIRLGYVRTDAEFVQRGVGSGAAAVTAIIKDGALWVGARPYLLAKVPQPLVGV